MGGGIAAWRLRHNRYGITVDTIVDAERYRQGRARSGVCPTIGPINRMWPISRGMKGTGNPRTSCAGVPSRLTHPAARTIRPCFNRPWRGVTSIVGRGGPTYLAWIYLRFLRRGSATATSPSNDKAEGSGTISKARSVIPFIHWPAPKLQNTPASSPLPMAELDSVQENTP